MFLFAPETSCAVLRAPENIYIEAVYSVVGNGYSEADGSTPVQHELPGATQRPPTYQFEDEEGFIFEEEEFLKRDPACSVAIHQTLSNQEVVYGFALCVLVCVCCVYYACVCTCRHTVYMCHQIRIDNYVNTCACGCGVYGPISLGYCTHSLSSHSYVIMYEGSLFTSLVNFAVGLLYWLGCADRGKTCSTCITACVYMHVCYCAYVRECSAHSTVAICESLSIPHTYIQTYIYLYVPCHSNR